MRKRRSICETMLTTSTESRPRFSRRFTESSRLGYFSPRSASRNSIRVWRISCRLIIQHLLACPKRAEYLHSALTNQFSRYLARLKSVAHEGGWGCPPTFGGTSIFLGLSCVSIAVYVKKRFRHVVGG